MGAAVTSLRYPLDPRTVAGDWRLEVSAERGNTSLLVPVLPATFRPPHPVQVEQLPFLVMVGDEESVKCSPLAGAGAAAPRRAREWRHAARQRHRQPRRHGPRRLRQPLPHRRDPGRRQTCAVQAGPDCHVFIYYMSGYVGRNPKLVSSRLINFHFLLLGTTPARMDIY